eukprot:6943682-Prymnesium_polylepis.1
MALKACVSSAVVRDGAEGSGWRSTVEGDGCLFGSAGRWRQKRGVSRGVGGSERGGLRRG